MSAARAAAAALAAAALLSIGCSETPREVGKAYAGKQDTTPYANDPFNGDKSKWSAALAERNTRQNEYARIPPPNKK